MNGYIPDEKVMEIKERANIVDIVSDYVSLGKAGKNYKGLCPFHTEKTPSFTVNEEKQIFYCFGCNTGGNIFSFVMKMDNSSFPEAARELAKRYGIDVPQNEMSETDKRETAKREKLLALNEIAAEYYHDILVRKEEGKGARDYLKGRGIGDDEINNHRLGYALDRWDGLTNFFMKKRLPLSMAEEVGLVAPRKGTGFYDRLRGRVIFPIMNVRNKVIGFGGRVLNKDLPKYLNSPESSVYQKSKSLYGLNTAKDFIKTKRNVIVVEGYFDLLALNSFGIKNVVATLGTALTQSHIDALKRYTKNVTIFFDGDEAGKNAAVRSLDTFLKEKISPKIALPPSGTDPDSFIRGVGKEGFQSSLDGSIPLIEFVINKIMKKHNPSSMEGKREIIKEVSSVLKSIEDEVEKDLYAQEVSSRLGLQGNSILLKAGKIRENYIGFQSEDLRIVREGMAEKLLLQLMLLHDSVVNKIREEEIIGEFTNQDYRRTGLLFLDVFDKEGKLDFTNIINLLEDESLKGLVSQLLLEDESIVDVEKTLNNCIRKIRMDRLKHEIKILDQGIKQAQRDKDEERWREFLVSRQKLMDKQRYYSRAYSDLNI